tara:strand:- start:1554 stop:2207 length:654 start_codon:yes stop_codon:yes gene_type:complete
MYFDQYQRILYEFPDGVKRVMTDMSLRPKFRDEITTNAINFEFYSVKDGDTPENLAYDYYNDEQKHWAILLANNIMSIYNDWPRDQQQQEEFLFQKYKVQPDSDGVLQTLTRVQVQEFTQFVGITGNNFTGHVTGTSVVTKPRHFVDADKNEYSYDAIVNNTTGQDANGIGVVYPTVSPVSISTYEEELNEAKRNIIIPSNNIIEKLIDEIQEYING